MPTVNDWITRAMRLCGQIAAGEVAAGQEAKDALEAANGLIMGMPEVGGVLGLREVIISAPYTAGEDERVISPGTYAVTLPMTVDDCGQVRTPRNGARVVILTPTAAVTHVYLKNSGWQKVSGLVLTDPAPLGPEVYTGLCALLAIHILPEFAESEANATVVALAADGRVTIAQQFWREVSVAAPPEFQITSDQGYPGDYGFSS